MHPVHDVRPPLERDALEDGEPRAEDVIEVGDAEVRRTHRDAVAARVAFVSRGASTEPWIRAFTRPCAQLAVVNAPPRRGWERADRRTPGREVAGAAELAPGI